MQSFQGRYPLSLNMGPEVTSSLPCLVPSMMPPSSVSLVRVRKAEQFIFNSFVSSKTFKFKFKWHVVLVCQSNGLSEVCMWVTSWGIFILIEGRRTKQHFEEQHSWVAGFQPTGEGFDGLTNTETETELCVFGGVRWVPFEPWNWQLQLIGWVLVTVTLLSEGTAVQSRGK